MTAAGLQEFGFASQLGSAAAQMKPGTAARGWCEWPEGMDATDSCDLSFCESRLTTNRGNRQTGAAGDPGHERCFSIFVASIPQTWPWVEEGLAAAGDTDLG